MAIVCGDLNIHFFFKYTPNNKFNFFDSHIGNLT